MRQRQPDLIARRRPIQAEASEKPARLPKARNTVNRVVSATDMARTWPPNGSINTSAIPKPAVPRAMMTSNRIIPGRTDNRAQASAKPGSAPRGALPRCRSRASCFHIATPFNTMVTTADP